MAKALLFVGLVIALCFTPTYSWGTVGHAVVASIAQNLIKANTFATVQIINGNRTMASVATQPDVYRGTAAGKWSSPLHFADMPAGATKFTEDTADCPKGMCVVGAIKNFTSQAANLPRREWPYSGSSSLPSPITFLIHFIGDVHQPLHVGWLSDLGGNRVQCTWFGKSNNLHSVWDSGFIDRSGLSESALTASLMTYIRANPSIVAQWRAQVNPSAWADESFQLVRHDVYNFGSAAGTMDLGAEYYNPNWPIVRDRLMQAGVRLAAILDSLYA